MKKIFVLFLIAIININITYCFASDADFNSVYAYNALQLSQPLANIKATEESIEAQKNQTDAEKRLQVTKSLAISSYVMMSASALLMVPGAIEWGTRKGQAKRNGMYMCYSGLGLFSLGFILMLPHAVLSKKIISKQADINIFPASTNVGFDINYSSDSKKYCVNVSYYF
jgi:hypothetical protein